MIITHKICMDLARRMLQPPIQVMQNDEYSRELEFSLTANGEPWDIPEGFAAMIRWHREPDKIGGNYDTLPGGDLAYSKRGNVLTVMLVPQICASPGQVYLTVMLASDSAVAHTFSVVINVCKNPGAQESVPAPEPDAYQQILNEYSMMSARVNNLASLKEGSTTGDAELIDGRMDHTGHVHENIGSHIREKTSELEKNTVSCNPQAWTGKQQAQARKNLDLQDVDEHGNAIFKTSVIASDIQVGSPASNVRFESAYDEDTPILLLQGSKGDESVVLGGIETPTADGHAANKAYVDNAVAPTLHYTEQALTPEQQAQARKNIGLYEVDEYGNIHVAKDIFARSVFAENVVAGDDNGEGVVLEGYYDKDNTPVLELIGSKGDEPVRIRYVTEPVNIGDAANKAYVDNAVADYYHTEIVPISDTDVTALQKAKCTNIYELYRALGPSEENTLKDFKGEETDLHEFVFSVGDYNSSGSYWIPDNVNKPTFLVTAGIHGYERTAVLSTYRFFADLVNGKNLPPYIKEGAIFKVVPVANPWGFDENNRNSANGVNINRNFDWEWEEQNVDKTASQGHYSNYSGPSVASEVETQAITNWLIANRDAVVFIDMHCAFDSSKYNVGIVGTMVPSVVKAKKIALRGLDKVIPFWRTSRTNGKKGFCYSVFADGYTDQGVFKRMVGPSTYYASDKLGIPAFAMEIISTEKNGVDQLSANNIAVGAECLGNVALETYKQYAMDVVAVKKYSTIADALAGEAETADGTVIAYEAASMLNILLTEDMTADETVEVTKDCTIHLNGHKLSFATGKHFYLTSGKLTINGAVPGSEISKAIVNGTAENLVSIDGVEGTELHLFGGVYSVIGTASSAIIPIRAGNGKAAKMTLSGCTLNMNCSGLAVYGVQASDDTTVDNCTFDVQVDTCTQFVISALSAPTKDSVIAIRNSNITINGGEVKGVNAFAGASQNVVVDNCTILASVTKEGAECRGIYDATDGARLTVKDSRIEASGNNAENGYAVDTGTSTEVHIYGGHYKGSNKALNLLGAAYINGLAVDGATYTAKEYDFNV